jgi:hypothetical protein
MNGKIVLQKVNGETRVLLFKAKKKATQKPKPKPVIEKVKPQIRYILQKVDGVTRLFMVKAKRRYPIGTVCTWNGIQYLKVAPGIWKPVSKNGQFAKKPIVQGSDTQHHDPTQPRQIVRDPDYSDISYEEAVSRELKYLRKQGKSSGNECMSILRISDNKVLNTWEGSKGSVNSNDDISKILEKSPANSIVLLHNHTNESSFSAKDLETMCKYKSVKGLQLICPSGMIYSVSIGKSTRVTPEVFKARMNEISALLGNQPPYKQALEDLKNSEHKTLKPILIQYINVRNLAVYRLFEWETQ